MHRDSLICNACGHQFIFVGRDETKTIEEGLAFLEWAQEIVEHVERCYDLEKEKWLKEKKGVG
jgi:hypothetical protein